MMELGLLIQPSYRNTERDNVDEDLLMDNRNEVAVGAPGLTTSVVDLIIHFPRLQTPVTLRWRPISQCRIRGTRSGSGYRTLFRDCECGGRLWMKI